MEKHLDMNNEDVNDNDNVNDNKDFYETDGGIDDIDDDDLLLDDNVEENDFDEEYKEEPNDKYNNRSRGSMNKKSKSGKRKINKKAATTAKAWLILLGIVVAAAIVLGIVLIIKNTPTKEKMSLYEYYNIDKNSDEVLIILNNTVDNDVKGIKKDDAIYLPLDYVYSHLTVRYYYDSESNSILYTDDKNTYVYSEDDKDVYINVNDNIYINVDKIAASGRFNYNIYNDPNKVVLWTDTNSFQCVKAEKNISVRYRGGIKSPVLEEVNAGEYMYYLKTVDEWYEVQTQSGIIGYVQSSQTGDVYEGENQTLPQQPQYEHKLLDNKISLSWFQVTNKTANNNIDSYLYDTAGINVISPTWYSITNNDGEVSCLATKEFVSQMHSQNIEVWPLIDDFDTSLDGMELYGSKNSRTNLINRLIADSKEYGYDGLNIDCEKVTRDSAVHYLQFLRELAVQCRANNIRLSVDNYRSYEFNSFYNISEQAVYVDYIILMGYDEHYAGSDSGSVASIGFVDGGIQAMLKSVTSDRLINAIPFYTRIWTETTTDGKKSTTSRAVGMQNAMDNLNKAGAVAIWDETTGQYFGSYENSDGSVVKIWLEEEKSVEEKMKLVKQYNLAGVAQWKLGLERSSVWSVINRYLE